MKVSFLTLTFATAACFAPFVGAQTNLRKLRKKKIIPEACRGLRRKQRRMCVRLYRCGCDSDCSTKRCQKRVDRAGARADFLPPACVLFLPPPLCPEGEEYDDISGECVPVSCESPNACNESEICTPWDIDCVQAPCAQFICCQQGEEYDDILGMCVPVSCESPNACDKSEICTPRDIVCVRAPCAQFTCCRPVLCEIYCPSGFKRDENGCEICECCEPVLCKIACQYGFKRDEEGCEICECNETP